MKYTYVISQESEPVTISLDNLATTLSIIIGVVSFIITAFKVWSEINNVYQHLKRQDVLFQKQVEVADEQTKQLNDELNEFRQEYRDDKALIYDQLLEIRKLVWTNKTIDRLVKEGFITQEQASDIKDNAD